MDNIARDFMNSVNIPSFAVLVGIFAWAFFTLIINIFKLFTGGEDQ